MDRSAPWRSPVKPARRCCPTCQPWPKQADFVVGGWFGILGPAGTPAAIIKRHETEIAAIGSSPEFKERIAFIGVEGDVVTGAKFASFIAAETALAHGCESGWHQTGVNARARSLSDSAV
ncbi:MAG: tripartite tricarboxylate transporter substrate-binding protein [Pseudomonadota bacterium]